MIFFLLADIAATSVEQCEIRYKEMLERAKRERGSHKTFQAEFIAADCSKVLSVQPCTVCFEFMSVEASQSLCFGRLFASFKFIHFCLRAKPECQDDV